MGSGRINIIAHCCFWEKGFDPSGGFPVMNFSVGLGFFLSLFLIGILLFRRMWRSESKTKPIVINLSILVITFLFLLTVLEIVFCNFIVLSDGFEVSLCSSHWFSKYWKPINSYGYRDDEHLNLQGKKIMFVVGDSHVAGHGVKDYRDRFSGVLASKLEPVWEVINIAKNGWNIREEYEAIVSYPHKPDAIILSYCFNEIEGTVQRAGLKKPVLIKPPPKMIKPLIEYSYFLNGLYWVLYRVRYGKKLEREYKNFITESYTNEFIWDLHKEEIFDIICFARNNQAKLLVIVFPHLFEINMSKMVYGSKVTAFLQNNDVLVIDVSERLKGRNPKKLIANWFDTHPNAGLHREIGEWVLACVKQWD